MKDLNDRPITHHDRKRVVWLKDKKICVAH